MNPIRYYSTNNTSERVTFETALMKGLASNYGLYMIAREDIPLLQASTIEAMKGLSYAQIAFEVLFPFLEEEIPRNNLVEILEDAYDETAIPTTIQHVTGKTFICGSLTAQPILSRIMLHGFLQEFLIIS